MIKKTGNILFYPFRKWFTLIERYVIGKFIVSTFFAHIIIIAIAMVIDFSEKSDNMLERNAPGVEIFHYYLDFIPYIASILAPLLIFLAVIFFTSRMAYNSEIIAMLNSGMNFRKFLRPYFFCGILSVCILLYANHFLVPRTNKTKLEFEDKYIHAPKTFGNNLRIKLDKQTFISLERFKFKNNEGYNFSLEKFEGSGENRTLSYKINANKIAYDSTKKSWRIIDYKKWKIDGIHESYSEGKYLDTILKLVPGDFDIDIRTKDVMTYNEMENYIKEKKQEGTGEIEFYRVEQYRRTSSAISAFILVMMGASLGSKKIRGGNWLNIIAGVALSALYIFFLQFSTTFSTNSSLHPVIGTNIPNILFALIALWLIRYASK